MFGETVKMIYKIYSFLHYFTTATTACLDKLALNVMFKSEDVSAAPCWPRMVFTWDKLSDGAAAVED